MGAAVARLYDAHPITAAVILEELAAQGKDLAELSPEDLFPLDQDHYGGAAATESLGLELRLAARDHVLDLCAGIGGPARYVAHRFGCRVTGVELVPSRVADARRLTELVGMSDRVSLAEGDVAALPLGKESVDVCMSQESFLHVADKAALFSECLRVLRRDGRLGFSDWVARPALSREEHDRLALAFSAAGIVEDDEYVAALESAGFRVTSVDDLGEVWKPSLRERLERLRSRRERNAARLGAAHADWWEGEYAFMVDLVHEGKLGGARFVAQTGVRPEA